MPIIRKVGGPYLITIPLGHTMYLQGANREVKVTAVVTVSLSWKEQRKNNGFEYKLKY